MRRRSLALSALLLVLAACDKSPQSDFIAPQFAKSSGTPTNDTFEATTNMSLPSSFGISADAYGAYMNKVGGVQAYIGVGGKDADLVTYNTSRQLLYSFDPSSTVFQASGIPSATFLAVSDFSGINYWGKYQDMSVGTTARVQGDFEFYVGRVTYELKYNDLAVYRASATDWLITTDCKRLSGSDPCYTYGIPWTPTPTAQLNVIRRNANQTFGNVTMPVTFHVTLQ